MKSAILVLVCCQAAAALTAGTWTSHGPANGAISLLSVAPTDRSVIYAAAPDGIFRTRDGGATWADVTGPISEPAGLVVSSADSDSVVVSAANGIYRSGDGGGTWQRGGAGLPATVRTGSLVIDPRDPNLLYVGSVCLTVFGGPGGVYKSTDGGRTFTPSMSGVTDYSRCASSGLLLDPLSPDRLYSSWFEADADGVTRSDDGGRNWANIGLSGSPGRGTVVGLPASQRRYAIDVGGRRLLTSTDGATWSVVQILAGIENNSIDFNTLALDPVPGRLYLGTSNGAYRSGDGGATWLHLEGPARDPVNAIDFDPSSGAVIVGTDFGLFRSANYPWNDWSDLHVGNSAMSIAQLIADFSNGDLYAESGKHLFRSSDLGKSWATIGDLLPASYQQIVVDASHHLYSHDLSFGAYNIWKLSPEGHWVQIRTANSTGLVSDPHEPSTLYSLELGSLARTRDGGATWERLQLPSSASSLAIDPRDSNVLIAPTFVGVVKSVDGGHTWSSDKAPAYWARFWIVRAPSDPDVLYMYARDGKSLYDFVLTRSVDGGETWTTLASQPITTGDIGVLAVDPRDPNTIFVPTVNGVQRSIDGGKSWQPISDGLPRPSRLSLVIDAKGAFLHLGTANRGVWELPLVERRRAAGH